ncbi:sigma 54-interacting transcriptional regulator [Clostridium sp.]|uniref:sigma-54 interaction domain-containing protein n=1 Tax=Clostridium sp. TaxID=1506 RepID=UPI002FC62A70
MSLDSIKDSVQEVAEAISAVLHVDVTIIDNKFKRIAATGEYKKLIGSKIPSKCLFEFIVKDKKPHYIEKKSSKDKDNLTDLVCYSCEAKDTCMEFATVGYPIMKDEEVIGIIGINIFDEKQCNIISKDFPSMIIFLNKLSTLLVGNIIYHDTIDKLQIQTEETNHIIDGLSDGILCVDNNGIIKYVNKKGERLLDIKEDFISNINIKHLFSNFSVNFLGRDYKGKTISAINKKQNFIVKSTPITCMGKRVSNIIQFNKRSDEVRAAYKLLGGSNIIRFEDIIGESTSISNVKLLAKSIAKADSTVLLRGESGTGKELFARSIHYASNREDAPFVAVNCASIPDNLLESEFFGYEGGAFSGARKEGQMGKFELASGGTIFLDEIGDLPIHLQPKILRALQEHSFTKIGGKEEIFVDVRIIAATNRNLETMVKNSQFREDLYYRLNVIPLYLPSLKERDEDIFLLSEYLLEKFCRKFNIGLKKLSNEVKMVFRNYSWPGNVRELENVIEYLINITKGEIIKLEDLPSSLNLNLDFEEIHKDKNSELLHHNRDTNKNILGKDLKSRVEEFEKELLQSMFSHFGKDAEGKNRIIEELGIDLSTLYRKLKKYNLQ